MNLPAHLEVHDSDPTILRDELLDLITRRIETHPRSQQKALGPSEIGHPCARRLGYKLLDTPENPAAPAWKATVGTAVHSWLEETLDDDNHDNYVKPHGFGRWNVEARVTVGQVGDEDIEGSCDLFDAVTGTVVDFKTCRCNARSKCDKRVNPGAQYRSQAHLYGRGWQQRGMRVERVALLFLPRNGELKDAHYWSEPYDEQVALDALQRVNGIALTVKTLGTAALPILPTADAWCHMCSYFKAGSTGLAAGCPGDPSAACNKPVDTSAPAFGAITTEENK